LFDVVVPVMLVPQLCFFALTFGFGFDFVGAAGFPVDTDGLALASSVCRPTVMLSGVPIASASAAMATRAEWRVRFMIR
jgi:hypothetical protein